MPKVTLRFQGRFLYAEDQKGLARPTRKITAIAANFDGSDFPAHQPLMSIRHGQVRFADKDHRPLTSLNPSQRIVADDEERDPQILIWDLAKSSVTYSVGRPSEPAIRNQGSEVASLKALEMNELRDADLNRESLNPKGALAKAVVVMTSGVGNSTTEHRVNHHYTKKKDIATPKSVDRKGAPGTKLSSFPSELVEFEVMFDSDDFAEDEEPFLTLEINGPQGDKKVCVRDGGVVCFSNTCPDLDTDHNEKVDKEFKRYYDLVKNGLTDDSLVPFIAPGALIEGIPCYQQSRIVYDGDLS